MCEEHDDKGAKTLKSNVAKDLRTRGKVRKRHFLRHLYIKCIVLPRQARDKHRESTQKRMAFSYRRPARRRSRWLMQQLARTWARWLSCSTRGRHRSTAAGEETRPFCTIFILKPTILPRQARATRTRTENSKKGDVFSSQCRRAQQDGAA